MCLLKRFDNTCGNGSQDSNICFAKVQQYDCNGNRVKKPKALSFTERPQTWKRCLYNEHLTAESNKDISIVESEKTANLMSYYRPDNNMASCWRFWLKCNTLRAYL